MRNVTFSAVQFACSWDRAKNIATAERLVRRAAQLGANVIVLPELFETPYFCAVQDRRFYDLAAPLAHHPTIERFQRLAAQLGVVIPVPVFEQTATALFNSVVVVDSNGAVAGRYRKSHIPQAPGYQEKFYFSPGDTGFTPIPTSYGVLGIAICWDQWFPEAARALVLNGTEFLLYPTAIGSEPSDASYDSMEHWRMVMRGHAAANMLPVVAANRIGNESIDPVSMRFYGSSFIAGPTGALAAQMDRDSEGVVTATFDLDQCRRDRISWGCFRDRRPDLYRPLLSLSGGAPPALSTDASSAAASSGELRTPSAERLAV
jgi:N-carbamoylputrescine amidase